MNITTYKPICPFCDSQDARLMLRHKLRPKYFCRSCDMFYTPQTRVNHIKIAAREMYAKGDKAVDIAKNLCVSRTLIYRYLKKIK